MTEENPQVPEHLSFRHNYNLQSDLKIIIKFSDQPNVQSFLKGDITNIFKLDLDRNIEYYEDINRTKHTPYPNTVRQMIKDVLPLLKLATRYDRSIFNPLNPANPDYVQPRYGYKHNGIWIESVF